MPGLSSVDRELSERCTFKPKTNVRADSTLSHKKFEQAFSKFSAEQAKAKAVEKPPTATSEERALASCTFKPRFTTIKQHEISKAEAIAQDLVNVLGTQDRQDQGSWVPLSRASCILLRTPWALVRCEHDGRVSKLLATDLAPLMRLKSPPDALPPIFEELRFMLGMTEELNYHQMLAWLMDHPEALVSMRKEHVSDKVRAEVWPYLAEGLSVRPRGDFSPRKRGQGRIQPSAFMGAVKVLWEWMVEMAEVPAEDVM